MILKDEKKIVMERQFLQKDKTQIYEIKCRSPRIIWKTKNSS